jgi:hypothetical protein
MITSSVRVIRGHDCADYHTTYAELARCVWSDRATVRGDGQFALLSCPRRDRERTIFLHGGREIADMARAFLDETGCGRSCTGARHELVQLALRVGRRAAG